MYLSSRARKTPASPIRRLAPFANAAKSSGAKVYHLNIGQPDIPSPPSFLKAVQSYSNKIVAYESSEGNQKLRENWPKYINKELNLKTSADRLLITMGASEALVFVFMTCCDPGDEVIIFDPTYANYIGFAAVTGVKLVPVQTFLDHGFKLPGEKAITQVITKKTKAILLCNPNNPTGTAYSAKEIKLLLDICEERDLFLIMDETYREILFGGLKPISALQLAPESKRIVVVDSLSKRFSLCGSRIGCLYANDEDLYQKCLNIAQARLAAPTIEQIAAAEMLENLEMDYFENVRAEYERRCNVLCSRLKSVAGIKLHQPEGAFYALARLGVEDAEEFAIYMLKEFRDKNETVFIAPGGGFYMSEGQGRNKARMAFVLNQGDLLRAGEILEMGLRAFLEKKN